MNTYGFEVAYGYEILKGYVSVENKEDAEKKILNEEWDDIIGEYETEKLAEGYEIIDIWQ